jgi:hypothetical protein
MFRTNRVVKVIATISGAILISISSCSKNSTNGVNSSLPSGTIKVTTQASGPGTDADGYTVTVLSSVKSIGINDTVYFGNVAPGAYSVSLDGLDAGCDVTGTNPRVGVIVTDGNTTTVDFDIACVAPASYGDISVTVVTSGSNGDAQYWIVVDGTDSTTVTTGTQLPDTTLVTITDTVGTHQVELVGVSSGCNIVSTNPQTIVVQESLESSVYFDVSCVGALTPNNIVFVRSDNLGISQVWVCDDQALNQTQLTFGGQNKNLPRWSPDGTKILYNGEVVDPYGVVTSGEIVIMNDDGTSPDTIAFPVNLKPGTADWSPDGTKLVVSGSLTSNPTEPNYFIYDFVTISAPLLSYTNQPGWFDIMFSMPFWSPVGGEIIFSGQNGLISVFNTKSIFSVPIGGGDATLIANDTLWGFSYPQWSEDGSKLAFNGPFSHIWSCNADGTNVHAVDEQGSNNGQPTWLPDGRIGFQPFNGVGLSIINEDGSGLMTIGVGPNAIFGQPDWNPNP